MMVRNDPPIYGQNNNIPIVVGTQQGHTVQSLPLQDIPIQQNIQNTSTSVRTPVVYNKNGSFKTPKLLSMKNQEIFGRTSVNENENIIIELNRSKDQLQNENHQLNQKLMEAEENFKNYEDSKLVKTFNLKNNSNRKQQENSEEPISCVYCGKSYY
ncbi:hypothetical protein BpHYR1_051042 [Brachionus plicatilis]|uniref:Uncharacterized protein n=1 Tax=Brachionus plicatilis TaxID=10195 RepID=A0A3M7SU50_BRAPC|nr:hypothetical protein BpHYR1_051042 [Brachionus plicatilis]